MIPKEEELRNLRLQIENLRAALAVDLPNHFRERGMLQGILAKMVLDVKHLENELMVTPETAPPRSGCPNCDSYEIDRDGNCRACGEEGV